MHFSVLQFGLAFCLIPTGFSQDKFNIADSINKFSIDLLAVSIKRNNGKNNTEQQKLDMLHI